MRHGRHAADDADRRDERLRTLLPGFLLFGIALGLVYAPMSTAAMAAMPHAKAGIAAGVLAMNRMVAGAFVLAGMGALFEHLRDDERVGESRRGVRSRSRARCGWSSGCVRSARC